MASFVSSGVHRQIGQQHQGVKILRVSFEDGVDLLPALSRLAAQQEKSPELQAHFEVFRVEVPGFQEKGKGVPRLAQFQVSKACAFECAGIAPVELDDVLVFDDCFLVVLFRVVTVSPLEVFGFLGLRRTGAGGNERHQQDKQPEQMKAF